MKIKSQKIVRFSALIVVAIVAIVAIIVVENSSRASAAVEDDTPNTARRWIITEVYLGKSADSTDGYVEIYNNSNNNAIGWHDFVINLPFNIDLPPLFGIQTIKPHSYKTYDLKNAIFRWSIMKYLTIMYGDSVIQEIQSADDEKSGYSYQRCETVQGDDSRVVSNQFYYGKKSEGKGIDCADSSVASTNPQDQPTSGLCRKLVLNEIGSNMDEEEQFVEISNTSNQEVGLQDCFMTTNKADQDLLIRLDDTALAPGDLYDINISDTDLPPLKKTAGVVYLMDSNQRTVVDYKRYSNMKVNTSVAVSDDDGDWYRTYTPTPGEPNLIKEYDDCPDGQIRDDVTHNCRKSTDPNTIDPTDEDDQDSKYKPCKEGYERNPETNRCRKIKNDEETEYDDTENDSSNNTNSSTLGACPTGQYRNPETNRCKKYETSTSSTSPTAQKTTSSNTNKSSNQLTACKDGYERNPETNRCRKIESTAATNKLTPCQDGYERNPDTNRCIKKKEADKANYPVSTSAEAHKTSNLTLIIALVLSAVVSIIVVTWQYRHEIGRFLSKFTKQQA